MSGLSSAQWSGRLIVTAFVLGMITYLTMILGPLAELEKIAGLKPFDLRPGGYSYDSARDLIAALGQEGRRIYLWRQIPLDTAYPALFAISVAGAICWFSRILAAPLNGLFRAVSYTAYLAGMADYLENALIVTMLNSGAEMSPSLTRFASAATISKSVLTSVAMTALLLAIILFLALKLKRSGNPN